MTLTTAGDLRGFLAEVLIGIKDGSVDATKAHAIAKVASQINASLATEVQARIHLKALGSDAGGMVITTPAVKGQAPVDVPLLPEQNSDQEAGIAPEAQKSAENAVAPAPRAATEQVAIKNLEDATANYLRSTGRTGEEKVWCDQCDMRVTVGQAVGCKSPHCKAKGAL